MRYLLSIQLVFVLLASGLTGCGGPSLNKELYRPTLPDVEKPNTTLPRKVAVALVGRPGSAFGGRVADQFIALLVENIQKRNKAVRLVTAQSQDYPQFLADVDTVGALGDAFAFSEQARLYGLQGVLVVHVSDFQPSTRKTGFWFFRKMRYFMSFSARYDLYDPFYAAKMSSALQEETLKIDTEDYESLQYDSQSESDDVNEAVTEIAEDFGKAIGKVLSKHPWKTSILSVADGRILIAADDRSGLEVGSRLAVFEGRRVISGPQGGQFIVPGYKIGEVRIISVNSAFCEAVSEAPSVIKAGDIAVAVK